jgi:hypothetical protein
MVTNVTKTENVTERKRMNEKIKELTESEMQRLGKNDRQFKEWLNESLSPESDTYIRSHGTIVNMRVHGKAPNTDFLEDMLSVYPVNDRRFRFALRMLAAKAPHIWGFGGVVWTLRASRLAKFD